MASEIEQAVLQLNQRAAALLNAGQYQYAIYIAEQAVSLASQLGTKHPDYARSLNDLAVMYRSIGDYQKAAPLFREAMEIRRHVFGEQHPAYAHSLNNLAKLCAAMGDYRQAEPLCLEAVKIRREALGEQHPDYATSLNDLATLYWSTGDYRQAEPLYRQALKICREGWGEQHPDYATTLHNLAALYGSMGEYHQAESLYHRVMEIWRVVVGEKHPYYAHSLNGLAEIYRAMRDYEKAEPLYLKGAQIWQEVAGKMHPDYAGTLNNLALLYRSMLEYEKAVPLLREVLEIRRQVLGEKHPDYATSLNNLALLYHAARDYQQAESLFRQATAIWREVFGEKHPDYAHSLNNLAVLYEAMGDYPKAEPYYRQAIELYRELLGERHPDYVTCLDNLAVFLAANDRHSEVLESVKQVADLRNAFIGQIFSMSSERQRTTFLKTLEPEFFSLLSLLCYAIPQSATVRQTALEIVLRRKAIRAEALMAQRDSVLGGNYPHLESKLRDLSKLREQIALKTLAGPGQAGLAAHQQTLAEWESQKEALETELARQIPEVNLEQKLRNIDCGVVAKALPASSALVEFVRFDVFDFKKTHSESPWKPAHYWAFILPAGRADDLQMLDLGEAEGIDRLIATFRAAVTGEDEGRGLGKAPRQAEEELFSKHGKALRARVFDKLLQSLGGCKRLFIAPDGDLTRLPFEILPTDDGSFLIDNYRLSYLGVGRDLLRFAAASSGQPAEPIVVADPDFDLAEDLPPWYRPEPKPSAARLSRDFDRSSLQFSRLPGTHIEGERIAQMLKVEPLLEASAVESRIKACKSPRLLHIATHGFFLQDEERNLNQEQRGLGAMPSGAAFGMASLTDAKLENPLLRSGLVLAGVNTYLKKSTLPEEAEDGILTAEDVSGLDLLATELVVLSACETGLGAVSIGEGVFGLRRAFVLAGAKTLVMSLWKVPDKQTQELMELFYQKILNGQPCAEALREAQLAIKAQHPEPLYWGAFICQGYDGPLTD